MKKRSDPHVWNLFNFLKEEKSNYEEKLFGSWNDESKRSYYQGQILLVNQQQSELIKSMANNDRATDLSSMAERIAQIEQIVHT